jgi:hypothetical protein
VYLDQLIIQSLPAFIIGLLRFFKKGHILHILYRLHDVLIPVMLDRQILVLKLIFHCSECCS